MKPNKTLVSSRYSWLLAGLLVLSPAIPVRAASDTASGRPGFDADPAFDRYANLNLLAQAWVDKNAPLLADLGLQLAEGERVLFRSHNGISADHVLAMAAKVAAEKKDTKTLDRLARALESLKKTDLAGQVAAAQKLAMASRAPDPALAIPVDKMSAEMFLLFRDTLDSITSAKIAGDGETLDIIIHLTPQMTRVPEAQRKYLVKAANQARATLGKDAPPDPAAEALNKLLEDSRNPRRRSRSIKEGSTLGVNYTATYKGLRVTGFIEGGPTALEKGAKLSKGDLILRIGNRTCYGDNTNLDDLVDSAYKSGNLELLVYQPTTRQVQQFELPRVQDVGLSPAGNEKTVQPSGAK